VTSTDTTAEVHTTAATVTAAGVTFRAYISQSYLRGGAHPWALDYQRGGVTVSALGDTFDDVCTLALALAPRLAEVEAAFARLLELRGVLRLAAAELRTDGNELCATVPDYPPF